MGENKTYTCPNTACGKTFKTPLKTINLQENPAEPYLACPTCLTKIAQVDVERAAEVKSEEFEEKPEKPVERAETTDLSGCRHHLGFLSERGRNEQIPDDCLVCRSIVDCMLKKMDS
jgi:hypothetical protein